MTCIIKRLSLYVFIALFTLFSFGFFSRKNLAIQCWQNVSQNTLNTANSKRLVFDIKFQKLVFRYIDYKVQAPNHIVERDFWDRQINGTIENKILLMKQRQQMGENSQQILKFVFPRIFDVIDRVEKSLNVKPVDSEVKFLPERKDMFEISKEKNGRVLDRQKLLENIVDSLIAGKSEVQASTVDIPALVTQNFNNQATFFRAKFSTDFSASNENRKNNIRLSLKKINGTCIMPNQEFSFNKVVGPRTPTRGYKESKIIVQGRFKDGVGGGVCQVSTTLYNAAIRADMCILSVKNHSLPVRYVDPSFDAMVNNGTSDLKFENTTTHPIYIKASDFNDHCSIEFYGLPMPYSIVPECEIVDTIPPPEFDEEIVDKDYDYISKDALSGDRLQVSHSKGGLLSKGYLCFYDNNNNLISRRLIRTDKYKAQQGLIAIAP
ncbi:MAG: VanW family protein [Clostridiales bacterium]|jgi:vancomycin resistance protein YoaR|nr:VanW family protein [Clostridiales bacterium]